MKRWFRLTFIKIVFFFLICSVSAQETDSLSYEETGYVEEDYSGEEYYETGYSGVLFSFDFHTNTPVMLTRDDLRKTIFGIHSQLLFQLNKSLPVFLGVSLTFGQYDQEKVQFYDFTEFEENLFEEGTQTYLSHFDAKLRYFPKGKFWIFQPFIDLTAGPRVSFATTSVTNLDYDENVSMKFEKADWGMSYGLGAGTLINLGKEVNDVFGHLSVHYVGGENSFFYLVKDDADNYDFTIDRFDRKSIPFNFLKIHLGICAYF